MNEYKINAYLDDLIDSYNEPVQRIEGLYRNPKEIIRKVEFYSVDQYTSGNLDELNRVKPFINQGNSRVRVAKTATDIDVKDIKYEPDSLTYSTEAMLYNHELYKWIKEANFSQSLNDMGLTRPKYGGLLVKNYDDGEGLEIEVVDWVNVDFNPSCIKDYPIIETHYMDPSQVVKKADVWTGYDNVMDAVKAHAKANKDKPAPIEIKEVTGEFSYSFDPKLNPSDENDMKFKTMCFYIAVVDKKKYLLHKEDLKDGEDKYKYLAWEKVGDGLGRGVWEEGFESQMWINDQYIQMKNALDLSGKVFTKGTVKGIGNAIVGVDNGHHFELKRPEDTLEAFQLSTAALPQFTNLITQFQNEYNRISSTFDANTGEQPPSGTPLGQTQILNQVANSPFQYQQEVWGIFLNEILNDWVLPHLKKRILKDHNLVSDFSEEELDMIDNDIASMHANNAVVEKILAEEIVQEGEPQAMYEAAKKGLTRYGKKREIKIPKGYLDIEGKITANITGELKNKGAILQSLDSVFKTVISTFNPQTGQYAALQDPVLKKVFAQIVEMSGVPFSSVQLSSTGGQPTSMTAQATTAPAMA
jgi:hypothetical protein